MRDANDTRFHLLLGQADWESAAFSPADLDQKQEKDLAWDADRHAVRLTREVFLFTAHQGDYRPRQDDRRGAGRDRRGNWYVIDAARARVRVTSAGSGLTTDFWPLPAARCDDRRDGGFRPRATEPAAPALRLDALVVTADHRLVVFAREDGSSPHTWLLAFDLLEGGPPDMLQWPDAIPLAPVDAAPHPDGGLWLLDRAKGRRLWRFNRHLRVEPLPPAQPDPPAPWAGDFRSKNGDDDDPRPAATSPLRESDACPLPDLEFVSVEVVDADRILLLERRPEASREASVIHGYRSDGEQWRTWGTVTLDLSPVLPPTAGEPADERLPIAHDIALVDFPTPHGDDAPTGRLYVASWLGNQAFQFELRATTDGFSLAAEGAYVPMRAFTGQGIVAAGGSVHYPSSDRWVPLREQRRARYRTRGELTTPIAEPPSWRQWFDGREPDCVWHRLLLDARIPHGCAIAVESRAARTPAELAVQGWRAEPPLRRRPRGSELPWTCPADDDREGTWELLFQHARGRFLQLRLTFTGDGTASPTLRALRAWYPRFSYLERYLPAVYREDTVSASFLERFLANTEGTFTAIEDRIAAAQALFDPRAVPEDFLPWLLGWFGAEAEVLPDARRRELFLRHAMTLYRARGTAPGLAMALRLALTEDLDEAALLCPDTAPRRGIRVIEQFRLRDPAARRAGDPRRPDGSPVVPSDLATAIARADAVAARYAGELVARRADATPPPEFPLKAPDGDGPRAAWERVARAELGLVPTVAASADAPALARWRAFLRRRYRTPEALRAAHDLPDTADFAAAELPRSLPRTEAAFRDWYDYETVVLARARRAHWFTVQLPITTAAVASWRDAMARRDVAERVVDLQKPAHTICDVRLFWSLFRVGDARLGVDTELAAGSRAPLPPAVADASWLGESRLAGGDDDDLPGVCPSERPVLR